MSSCASTKTNSAIFDFSCYRISSETTWWIRNKLAYCVRLNVQVQKTIPVCRQIWPFFMNLSHMSCVCITDVKNSCESFTEVNDPNVLVTYWKIRTNSSQYVTNTFEFFTLVTDSFDFHIRTNLSHMWRIRTYLSYMWKIRTNSSQVWQVRANSSHV